MEGKRKHLEEILKLIKRNNPEWRRPPKRSPSEDITVIEISLNRPGDVINRSRDLIERTGMDDLSDLQHHQLVSSYVPCTIVNTTPEEGRGSGENLRVKRNRMYICRGCNNSYRCIESLRSHVSGAHRALPIFHCHKCKKSFLNEGNLDHHVALHDKPATQHKFWKCPVCYSVFGNERGLSSHFTDVPEHRPSLPPAVFKSAAHTQPFVCSICGNGYQRKYSLQRHTDKKHKSLQ